MAEKLEFSIDEEWARFKKESPWAVCVLENAKDAKGRMHIRKVGTTISYQEIVKGTNTLYKCDQCGSEVLSGRVAHPIHDGPFPLSGSGRCHYEEVLYCPKCEKEPNLSDAPITNFHKF